MTPPFEVSLIDVNFDTQPSMAFKRALDATKATLLYADRLVIASPNVLYGEVLAGYQEWGREEQLDHAAGFIREAVLRETTRQTGLDTEGDLIAYQVAADKLVAAGKIPDLTLEQYEWALRRLSGQRPITDLVHEAAALKGWRSSEPIHRNLELIRQRYEQLATAESSGLVEVRRVQYGLRAEVGQAVRGIAMMRDEAMSDRALIIDSRTARFLAAALPTHDAFARSSQALLNNYPWFVAASVEEILQIREAASDSLTGFRARLGSLSDGVTADMPDTEVVETMRKRIITGLAPEVEELERELEDSAVFTRIRERVLNGGTWARMVAEAGAATIGLGVLGKPALVTAALAYAGEASGVVLGAVRDAQQAAIRARRNPLYVILEGQTRARRASRARSRRR